VFENGAERIFGPKSYEMIGSENNEELHNLYSFPVIRMSKEKEMFKACSRPGKKLIRSFSGKPERESTRKT
jgi:hypothetical protein